MRENGYGLVSIQGVVRDDRRVCATMSRTYTYIIHTHADELNNKLITIPPFSPIHYTHMRTCTYMDIHLKEKNKMDIHTN